MNRLSALQKHVHEQRDIDCPTCEGDGEVRRGRKGGRWNSYIGTWEPDDWGETCSECYGDGKVEAMWCPACEDVVGDDGNCHCGVYDLLDYLENERLEKVGHLYGRIVNAELQQQRIHTAPDEVVHRRVDGRTVISRRLFHRRTTNPPLGEAP